MNAATVARLELLALFAGVAAVVIALAAVDWRLGLFVAGLCLVGAALDIPWRRR